MTRNACIFLSLALLLGLGGCRGGVVGSREPRAEDVQADVLRLQEALQSGDVQTVLDMTHPVVIEALGGRDAAEAALSAAVGQLNGQQMVVESFSFPSEPVFITGEVHQFAIIPTHSVLSTGGQRVESRNYQFGVRRVGERQWRYIEGSQVDQQNVRLMFPDFPAAFVFPQTSRRLLP